MGCAHPPPARALKRARTEVVARVTTQARPHPIPAPYIMMHCALLASRRAGATQARRARRERPQPSVTELRIHKCALHPPLSPRAQLALSAPWWRCGRRTRPLEACCARSPPPPPPLLSVAVTRLSASPRLSRAPSPPRPPALAPERPHALFVSEARPRRGLFGRPAGPFLAQATSWGWEYSYIKLRELTEIYSVNPDSEMTDQITGLFVRRAAKSDLVNCRVTRTRSEMIQNESKWIKMTHTNAL